MSSSYVSFPCHPCTLLAASVQHMYPKNQFKFYRKILFILSSVFWVLAPSVRPLCMEWDEFKDDDQAIRYCMPTADEARNYSTRDGLRHSQDGRSPTVVRQ